MKNIISFKEVKPLLDLHYRTNQVPFLVGAPGIGKSSILKELANKYNTKVFTLSVNHLGSREDLTGVRSIKDEKTETYRQIFFPHAIIQDAIDHAVANPKENPILFLDEINRTDSDVTSAIMALITERRVGTTNFPDNLRLVAAGNDSGNVNTLDSASISRTAIYHMNPDIQEFLNANPNLNKYIKDALLKNPNLLISLNNEDSMPDDNDDDDDNDLSMEQLFDTDTMVQITVPRTITYLSEILEEAGFNGKTLPDDISEYIDVLEFSNSPIQKLIFATIGQSELAENILNEINESISKLQQVSAQNAALLPKVDDTLLNAILTSDDKDQIVDLIESGQYTEETLVDSMFTILSIDNYKKAKYTQCLTDFYDVMALRNFEPENSQKLNKLFATAIQNDLIAKPILKHIKADTSPLSSTFEILINTLG